MGGCVEYLSVDVCIYSICASFDCYVDADVNLVQSRELIICYRV